MARPKPDPRFCIEVRGHGPDNWLHLRFMDEPAQGFTLREAKAHATKSPNMRIVPIKERQRHYP